MIRLDLTTKICLLVAVCTCHPAFAQEWDQPPPVVVLDEVKRTLLAPKVDVPGTVISRFDARLASELSAKLIWIADVGTKVNKGETVARLQSITYQLQEAEAAAQVAKEQARVKFLASEVKRLQQLAKQNNAAKSRLEQTMADLSMAQSDEAIAKARLGQAQVAMAVTKIDAPFDGIVTEKLRQLGERLNVADEVIRLVDPERIEVVARAPLNTMNFVRENDELQMHNDYRSGFATIRTIVPFGDPQSHMFEVRLKADASVWTVGESVRLAMPTAKGKEVLSVPRDALILRRGGIAVFRVNEDLSAEQIQVTTGLGDGALIEVIGDLNPGEKVVVRGGERLESGQQVVVSDKTSGRAEVRAKP